MSIITTTIMIIITITVTIMIIILMIITVMIIISNITLSGHTLTGSGGEVALVSLTYTSTLSITASL